MSHLSICSKKVIAVILFILFCVSMTGIVSAQDSIPQAEDDAFWAFLEKLEKNREITSLNGSATYYGDYTWEWAKLGWYQWKLFENAERFVLSSKVSWDSASQTPNSFESGCGIIFNANSINNDHLMASLRMDGLVYFTGKRSGQDITYGTYGFGSPSIRKTVDVALVVDHDKASLYINGQRFVRKANMYVLGDGVGLSTISGTNKDFGTRCEWKDIFFYTW